MNPFIWIIAALMAFDAVREMMGAASIMSML
ncbi:KPN_01571 family protein [Pseudescherichia sp.]